MNFKIRLNHLISALNVKNSEIAGRIFVAPSLITRWRNGSRSPSDENLQHLSAYFAELLSKRDSRFVCKLLDMPYTRDFTLESLTEILYIWFAEKGTIVSEIPSESSLTGIQAKDLSEQSGDSGLIVNSEGIRYHIQMLLEAALNRNRPFTILICNEGRFNWLLESEQFYRKWAELIEQASLKGANFRIIYHLSRSIDKSLSYVKSYLPFFRSAKTEIFYFKKQNFRRSFDNFMFIIPDVGAIISTGVNRSVNCYANLITRKYYIDLLITDFEELLSNSSPLASFSKKIDLYGLSERFEHGMWSAPGVLGYMQSLPLFTLPAKTLQNMLAEAGYSQKEIPELLECQRTLTNAYLTYLKSESYVMYAYFPPELLDYERDEKKPWQESVNWFDRPLAYTKEYFLEHLKRTVQVLETFRSFEFLIGSKPLHDLSFFSDYENFSFLSNTEYPYGIYVTHNPLFCNDLTNYFSSLMDEQNCFFASRTESISILQSLVQKLITKKEE